MLVRALVASVALIASASLMAAEPGRLKIPDFSHLQAKARESVDITVGPFMLWLAQKFVPERDENGTEVKKLLEGIDAVYIRSYQFDADNVYSSDDIETVRKQLRQEHWKPLVEVHSKQAENVDIFIAIENDTPTGFAIVASKPREFTIINVVGTIDPQYIGRLHASMGLPGAKTKMASIND